MKVAHALVLASSLTVAFAGRTDSQSVQHIRLSRPEVEFPTGFTQISSVRWLTDGRVVVVDAQERSVQLIDAALRSAKQIGRPGAGPAEFAAPRRLYALRADTTLLFDPGNDRFLTILPDGRAGSTFTLGAAEPANAVALRGVDGDRRFYHQIRKGSAPQAFGSGGGEELLTRLVVGSRIDTLATLVVPAGREEGSMTVGQGLVRRLTNRPLAAEDVVAVAHDGWVAIVRGQPFRVEWIQPGGQHTVGPLIVHEPIRVTAAERRAFLDAQVVPGQIIVRGAPGARAAPLPPSRGNVRPGERPPPAGFDDASLKWPTHKPPFLSNAALMGADSRLWVLRTAPHTDAIPHYDVFDRRGQLVLRVDLPPHTRLVGLGAGIVFVARTDDQDLQYLQRYRL